MKGCRFWSQQRRVRYLLTAGWKIFKGQGRRLVKLCVNLTQCLGFGIISTWWIWNLVKCWLRCNLDENLRGTPEIAAIFVKWLVFFHFFNSFRWSYGTCLQVCWGWVVTLLSLFSVSWVGKQNIFDFLGCFCVSARCFGTGIGPLGLEPLVWNGSGEGMNTHDRCTICRSRTNDYLVKLQWPQWIIFFLLGWDVISVTRNIVMCKCMWVEWFGLWEGMWQPTLKLSCGSALGVDVWWSLNIELSAIKSGQREHLWLPATPLGPMCASWLCGNFCRFAHVEYYHFATHFALVVWYPHVGPAVKNMF